MAKSFASGQLSRHLCSCIIYGDIDAGIIQSDDKENRKMLRSIIIIVGFICSLIACQDGNEGRTETIGETSAMLRTCEQDLIGYRWDTFNSSIWQVCNEDFVAGRPHDGIRCQLALCQYHLRKQKDDNVTTSPHPDD